MNRRYAVIAGASRGIGQAIAMTLAQKGYVNILIGRSKEGLEETAALCGRFTEANIIAADVTCELSRVVDEIKKLTSHVNFLWLGTAGFSDEQISQVPAQTIREFIRSGYESLVELVHLLYPLLADGHAHIVGACSDWSDLHSGGPSVFGSTKVALAGFLDKLRAEAKGDSIQVTALKMGNVGNLEGFGLDDFGRQYQETGTRMVALRDVCDAIEFIISRKTGTVAEMTLVPAELGENKI